MIWSRTAPPTAVTLSSLRHLAVLVSLPLGLALACSESGSVGSAGGRGEALAGEGGQAPKGGSSSSEGGDRDSEPGGAPGSSTNAGAPTGPSAGTVNGGSGPTSRLYTPPAEIIGGPCQGAAMPALPACTDAPEQVYCRLDDPTQVIMAVCSAAGRSQCEVMDECEPGWHACTATDYVARGGRDMPPSFSSATDRAWLAACARDATGTQLKNEPCSVCGQDVGFPPSIQWWCDGSVVYEGGMDGDTLGIVAAPECMRVGANTAGHGAFWTMSFSDGAPSFVMCCSSD